MKKILVVCSKGEVRSVGLAYVLKEERGYSDVLAAGANKNSKETLQMLYNWADVILAVDTDIMTDVLSLADPRKVKLVNIGFDRFGNPGSIALNTIAKQALADSDWKD